MDNLTQRSPNFQDGGRMQLIDDARLVVFDDLLPTADLLKLYSAIQKSGFTRTEMATPETAEYRHWVSEIPVASLSSLPVYALTLRAVAALEPQRSCRPYRSYVNASQHGDVLFSHRDCAPGARELTALWYICDKWLADWAGETVFIDAAGELAASVLPRPGRLVIFDGHVLHAGRPPSRVCPLTRYTLAIKLESMPG